MKIIIMAIAVLFAATTVTFAQAKKAKTPKTTIAKKYTCPMHPDVLKTKAGKCPECGMALVAKPAAAVTYTCTMDPEVITSKPGKCPKCGMALTKMKSNTMATDTTGIKM